MVEGEIVNKESIWWQDIMVVTHDHQLLNVLQNETKWRMRSGDKIRFWEDCWNVDGELLKRKYPRLYLISCQQQKLINQVGRHMESTWEWKLEWRRPLFDNEVDAAVAFMGDISQVTIQQHIADGWVWKPEHSGNYSTRSAYNLLHGGVAEEIADYAFGDLWKLKILVKVSIFAWRLIRDRLPTKSNLRRR